MNTPDSAVPSLVTASSTSARELGWVYILLPTLAIFVSGLLDHTANLALFYLVPVTLAGTRGRNAQVLLTCCVVLLIFGGYFISLRDFPSGTWNKVESHRLVNRTLISLMLCIIGAIQPIAEKHIASLKYEPTDSLATFVELILQTWSAFLLCLVATGLVLVMETVTPLKYNLSVFFALPVTLCLVFPSVRLLIIMTGFAVAMAVVALLIAPRGGVTEPILENLLQNRYITIGAILAFAAAVFWQIRQIARY